MCCDRCVLALHCGRPGPGESINSWELKILWFYSESSWDKTIATKLCTCPGCAWYVAWVVAALFDRAAYLTHSAVVVIVIVLDSIRTPSTRTPTLLKSSAVHVCALIMWRHSCLNRLWRPWWQHNTLVEIIDSAFFFLSEWNVPFARPTRFAISISPSKLTGENMPVNKLFQLHLPSYDCRNALRKKKKKKKKNLK